MVKKIASLFALVALTFSGLTALALPASAAPLSSDATLSDLQIYAVGDYSYTGQVMTPMFSSTQSYYEVYSNLQDMNFFAVANDPDATITITGGDANNAPLPQGTDTPVHFPLGANHLVKITVTATDSSTKTYTVNMSNGEMPQPQVISYAPSTLSTAGGDSGVVYIKHFYSPAYYGGGNNCYSDLQSRYDYIDANGNSQSEQEMIANPWAVSPPDENGISKIFTGNIGTKDSFRNADAKPSIIARNSCNVMDPKTSNWMNPTATTVVPNAFTFVNPTVSSIDAPATISQMSVIKINGVGLHQYGFISAHLENLATGSRLGVELRRSDDSSVMAFVNPYIDASKRADWNAPADVKLVVEQIKVDSNWQQVGSYQLFSQDLKFTPELPTQVTISPAKGPVAGGNLVKISGHHLCNGAFYQLPVITIGGNKVSGLTELSGCSAGSGESSYDAYWQSDNGKTFDGIDKLAFVVPAAQVEGNAAITLDIGYGPTTLATKYTYGAKPVVTSIVPSTVANSGGSIVTINGSGFGISGTPVVTFDGVKSPYVVRVNGTKLLAMVPASAKTGSVDVNVVSSSGGGSLDTPAALSYAAASSNPTITAVSPSTGAVTGGESITISGTGFAAKTTGVTIGGVPARVTAVTATSITVDTPNSSTAGEVDVVVGTPTGLATGIAAFTYTPVAGITSVSPRTIKTTDTGDATKVTIAGFGLGDSGTLTIGGGAPVAYVATGNGTLISGVVIPTDATGSLKIVITPANATASFTTSVTVVGPVITYVGPDPYDQWVGVGKLGGNGGQVMATTTAAGGDALLIKGKNFGASGTVRIGNTVVTPTSYSDTEIQFVSPAVGAGLYDVTVVPSDGTVTSTAAGALEVGALASGPRIDSVISTNPNARSADANTFDPTLDISDLFTITGNGFAGDDNGAATKVQISPYYSEGNWIDLTPVSVSNSSVTFHTPRDLGTYQWMSVRVVTSNSSVSYTHAIFYVGDAPQGNSMSPAEGLCTKEAAGPYTPAVVVATGPGIFGESGTVSIDGTDVNSAAITWTADSVTIDFGALPANIANPWGAKNFTFTPADATLPAQTWGFYCGVQGSVTTKLDGSTNDLTIAVGTSYSASAEWKDHVPGTTYVGQDAGYYYQTAADYGTWARGTNVQSGLPKAAGDYYIWANTDTATWDRVKYSRVYSENVVHLVITGTPITFTPKLTSGSGDTVVYSGQLGDGTDGSSNDITYTVGSTADPVTGVTWQYRNHYCAQAYPDTGWTPGLPNSVAVEAGYCGGDDSTVSSWDIRVAGFEMSASGTDKSYYYLPSYDVFNLTITKKSLTINTIQADKVYDGNANIYLGDLTVSGAVNGENPTLDYNFAGGAAFEDATAGNNKKIVLPGPIVLSAPFSNNYSISNPDLQITGSIKKADAVLKLVPSQKSVLLGSTSTVNLDVQVNDSRGGQQIADANAPAPTVVSITPTVCTYDGSTITILAVGSCVIQATQGASTNYNAATSYTDGSSVEELTIPVYSTPKSITVMADDLQVAVGDAVEPNFETFGLLDSDSWDGVTFEYYQGGNLIQGVPTEPGTYTIVPVGGWLTAADTQAYLDTVNYVPAKLIIAAAVPEITASSPAHGPEAGGNTLVITGTGLAGVTSITIGDVTLGAGQFTVNQDGTEISLVMPAGTGTVDVTLFAGGVEVPTSYTYDPSDVPPTAPLNINLELKLTIGAKLSGQPVLVTGGGLKPNSQYTLVMHSKSLLIYSALTDADGNFRETIIIPAKACLAAGRHDLTLTGISPAGASVTSVGYFTLDTSCHVLAQAVQSGSKTWTLTGFLFDFLSPKLTAKGVKSLKALAKFIKGAKKVTIYGYTETTHSKSVHKYNLKLSQARCNTVKAFLKKLGINAKYKTVPKAGADYVSLSKQYLNRRVVITADF